MGEPTENDPREQYANWKAPDVSSRDSASGPEGLDVKGQEHKWGEYVEDPNKIYYHGSPDDYELDPDKTDSLFGGELYVTDHKDRAMNHVVGEKAKLYELNLRLKKVFEFDEPLPLAEANRLMGLAGLPLIPEREWSQYAAGETLHRRLSGGVVDRMTPEEKDTTGLINRRINDILRQAGYDAVRSPPARPGYHYAWRDQGFRYC